MLESLVFAYEALIDNRAKNLPADALSEVFGRLVWCLDDNGSSIFQLQRAWLEGDDAYRIEVVLTTPEGCVFQTLQEMQDILNSVRTKFPALAKRCDEYEAIFFEVLR